MAGLAAIVLLALVLEDTDLFAAQLADDLTGHGSALDHGVADRNGLAGEHHYREGHDVARFVVQLLHIDGIALRNAILFAASANNCVHFSSTSLNNLPLSLSRRQRTVSCREAARLTAHLKAPLKRLAAIR